MLRCPPRLLRLITIPVAAVCFISCGGPEKKIEEKLAANVLFFANFDDRSRFEAMTKKKGTVAAMETSSPPRHEFTGGKEDGFVSFANGATYLSYQAKDNFPYRAGGPWSGGVSFWLSVDPNSDFKEKFPEPFSIGKEVGRRGHLRRLRQEPDGSSSQRPPIRLLPRQNAESRGGNG